MSPRVLVALLALSCLSACARVNPQRFQPLVESGRAIASALTTGPSLPAFRPLRQQFSTALTTVKPTLQSAAERTIFGEYEVINQRLEDMLTVWTGLMERDEAMLPVGQPLGQGLKERYDLPVNTNEPPSVYANEALVAIRDDITQRLTAAASALER